MSTTDLNGHRQSITTVESAAFMAQLKKANEAKEAKEAKETPNTPPQNDSATDTTKDNSSKTTPNPFAFLLGEASRHHPKHAETWYHAVLSLFLGLLCSVGLGIYAVDHQWFTNIPELNISSTYDKYGYFLLSYQVIMLLCRAYIKGPEELYNQLWACNAGMALATTGIITHRPVMVGAAVGVVAIDQVLWYFDCLLRITTGKFRIGVAKYLDWPETPFIQKLFSWHHLWFLPMCLYYLRETGPGMPQGALPLSVLGVFSMTLITRLVTPKDLNINMAFEFWVDIKIPFLHVMDEQSVFVYVPYILVVFNTINLPLWPLLVWAVGGYERVVV